MCPDADPGHTSEGHEGSIVHSAGEELPQGSADSADYMASENDRLSKTI